MVRLLVLLLLAGCTVDSQVLYTVDADVTDCEEIFALGEGAPCSGMIDCRRIDPSDPAQCCRQFAVCSEGILVIAPVCTGCERCEDDSVCPYGISICEENRCSEGCPDTTICPGCEEGLVPLFRNGCATCFCAPPSECLDPSSCGEGETCYPSEACANGCAPGDLQCCVHSCAPVEPPCPIPGKVGCQMACEPGMNCAFCYAADCVCGREGWSCTPACGLVDSPCFFP
jgi:hypothetical protein